MRYDVQEIRRSARQVSQAADLVRSPCGKICRVQDCLASNFRGRAADTLDHELSSLWSDLQQLAGGLAAINSELEAFASQLEQADANAAKTIREQ